MNIDELIKSLQNADCSSTQTRNNSTVFVRDDKGNGRMIAEVSRDSTFGIIYIDLEPPLS
jgi:hypothetical protein